MQKKSISLTIAVVFCAIFSFLAINCETGLGSAVDVQKPSVSITYPPANAAIREEFVLAGTCSDDQGVADITVTIYREGKLFEGSGPFKAEIDSDSSKPWKDGRSWSIKLNKGTENENAKPPLVPAKTFALQDGTYTIQVQGIDTSGRVSDIDSRSFIIDNTPPILILNKPMATKAEKPTSYGRVLKLAGDTNDDNDVTLTLYLKECASPAYIADKNVVKAELASKEVKTVKVENIGSMSSDAPLIVAKYFPDDKIKGDEARQALTDTYKDIYGTVKDVKTQGKNDNKYYYAGIRLSDSARIYDDPKNPNKESTGNETDVYFINTDDLGTKLNSIGTDGIKARDVKAILNGTYSDSGIIETVKNILSTEGNYVECVSSEDVSIDSNVFCLNPDNNPTWSIANYSLKNKYAAADSYGFRDYNIGAAHSLTITPNTDGDYIVPEKVKLYYRLCEKVGDEYKEIKENKKNYLIDFENKGLEITFDDEPGKEAITKGNIRIQDKLSANEYYVFGLEGTDRDGNEYEPDDENGYGFKVAVSEIAATLDVKQKNEYFKFTDILSTDGGKTGGILFEGTIVDVNKKLGYSNGTETLEPIEVTVLAKDEDGKLLENALQPKIAMTLVATDDGENKGKSWYGTSGSEKNWDLESREWDWSVRIYNDSLTGFKNENYTYAVTIKVHNSVKLPTTYTKTVKGDNVVPELKFTNTEFFVNGESGALKATPIVTEDSNQIDKKERTFTMSGTWSDIGGSSPKALYYWYGNDISAIPPKTEISETYDAAKWTKATGNQASSGNNEYESNWFIKTTQMTDSQGNVFVVWAKDAVDNETDIVTVPNVMFDFSDPKVKINEVSGKDITKESVITNSKSLKITGTITDNHKLSGNPVFTVKKGGVAQTVSQTEGATVVSSVDTTDDKNYTWTITLNAGDTHATDGKWTIKVAAKDIAERSDDAESVEFTIDTTAPALLSDPAPTIGGKTPGDAVWITNTETPSLDFCYKEDLTGINKIYYWIYPISSLPADVANLAVSTATGSYSVEKEDGKWQLSKETKFGQGKYKVYLRAVDAVGNASAETTLYPVNIDTAVPVITYTGDDVINSDAKDDVLISVTVTDTASKIETVQFKFGDEVLDAPAKADSVYTATVPKNKLTATNNIYVTATNVAKKSSDSKDVCQIFVDTTAPDLKVTTLNDNDKVGGRYIIKENSAKSIVPAEKDKDGKAQYTFTLGGTWSDVGGTGTNVLSYSTDSGTTWKPLIENEAPKSKSTVQWSKTFTIKEDDNAVHSYWVKATDIVGNESAIQKFDNLIFDFSAPKITAAKYYTLTNLKDKANVVTVTASDTRKLTTSPMSFEFYKDGTKVDTLPSGLTHTSPAGGGTSAVYTITFAKAATTLDGVWNIKATATDDAERPVTWESEEITIDTKAPVIRSGSVVFTKYKDSSNNNLPVGPSRWFKDTSFKMQGEVTDIVSGVSEVYYWIFDSGDKSSQCVIESDTESFTLKPESPDSTSAGTKTYKFEPTVSGFKEGQNYVYFKAVDAAGNESDLEGPLNVKIDNSAPQASLDPGYVNLTNDSKPMTFTGTVKDSGNASGVKTFTLKLGDNTLSVTDTGGTGATDSSSGKGTITLGAITEVKDASNNVVERTRTWTATINNGVFGSAASGSLSLDYSIEDAAGNANNNMHFDNITLDKEAPKPQVSQTLKGVTVNKKFIVSGTNKDDRTIKELELKYKIDGSYTTFGGGLKKSGTDYAMQDGSYIWDKDETGGIKIEGDVGTWSVIIDSIEAFGETNAAQEKNVTIVAISTDVAGNTSAEDLSGASVKFGVDQNTDRPEITLSTVVSKIGSNYYVGEEKLRGNVIDDDGISAFYISESEMTFDANGKRTGGGSEITLSGSSWEYDLVSDGNKTLYFYVEDTEGGVFSYKYTSKYKLGTSSEANDKFGNPYLAYSSGTSKTTEDLTARFACTRDTLDPVVSAMTVTYNGTGSGATEVTEPTESRSVYVGGNLRNKVKLNLAATDTNGISRMNVEVKDSADNSKAKYSTDASKEPAGSGFTTKSGLSNGKWTVDLGTLTKSGWSDGDYRAIITAYDSSNRSKTVTYTFKVDFTAPNVTAFSTKSTPVIEKTELSAIFADNDLGAGMPTNNDSGNVQWLLPTLSVQDAATINGEVVSYSTSGWKNTTNIGSLQSGDDIKTLAWKDVSTYSNTGSGGYAKEITSGAEKGILQIPVWFKLRDILGNEQIIQKIIKVDPDASRAKVEINSPAPIKEGTITKIDDYEKFGASTSFSGTSSVEDGNMTNGQVRLQFDANGDGAYDAKDFRILKGIAEASDIGSSKVSINGEDVSTTNLSDADRLNKSNEQWASWATSERLKGDVSNWYVVADRGSSASSWKLPINVSMFNLCYDFSKNNDTITYTTGWTLRSKAGINPFVTMRVLAWDGKYDYNESGKELNGKEGRATVEHIRKFTDASLTGENGVVETAFLIDTGIPEISNRRLVQYKDNDTAKAETMSIAYTTGMYISPKMVNNGQWFFVADIEDETALDYYSIDDGVFTGTKTQQKLPSVATAEHKAKNAISKDSDVKTATIKVPITITDTTDSDPTKHKITGDGVIYLEVTVGDTTGKIAHEFITVYTDGTAPTMPKVSNAADAELALYSDIGKLGAEYNVEQSDKSFSLGTNPLEDSGVTDSGDSGLKLLAFWFERQPKTTDPTYDYKRVYNPMIKNTDGVRDNATSGITTLNNTSYSVKTGADSSVASGTLFINSDDGLALYKVIGSERTNAKEFTLTAANANIRKGGLVYIGGNYVVISAVSGTTVTFAQEIDTKFTTAYFAFAQVVDRFGEEPSDNGTATGDCDGDSMKEKLNSMGVWRANFMSDNIPDGPIIIHVTAIDNAGNASTGTLKTKVANNRPRIAKVMVGTDWNKNGSFEVENISKIKNVAGATDNTADGSQFGEFTFYSALGTKLNSINGYEQSVVTINNVGTATDDKYKVGDNGNYFIAASKICVIPEFTGGNFKTTGSAGLKYTWNVTKVDGTGTKDTASSTLASLKRTTVTESGSTITISDNNLELGGESKDIKALVQNGTKYGGIIIDKTTLTAHENWKTMTNRSTSLFNFTFWDETPETTQGTDSLSAVLRIPMYVNVQDEEAPKAWIHPFHWNSRSDNSVYQDADGNLYGHIELEGDLTDTLKANPYGTGPKVSGKIVIRGKAQDEMRLGKIGIAFEGVTGLTSNFDVLEYKNGVMTQVATLPDSGAVISAKAIVDRADTTGHTVEFEIVVDTEKLATVAGINKGIRIYAADNSDYVSGGNKFAPADDAASTESTAETAYYKVDVVPYITRVITGLAGVKEDVDITSTNRSALGVYPVKEDERIAVEGYNLKPGVDNSGTVTGGYAFANVPKIEKDIKAALTTGTVNGVSRPYTFLVGQGTGADNASYKSGEWEIYVDNIPAVNNHNKNDAKGKYEKPEGSTMHGYANYYNRYMNDENNNNLNDDLKFEVWQINSRAARNYEGAGPLREPVVKINPTNGQIGMAFSNGAGRFSMAGKGNTNNYSYGLWQKNYATYRNVALVYDVDGHSHAISTGIDTYPDNGKSGRMSYYTDIWGRSAHTSQSGNFTGTNCVRFECIGLHDTTIHGETIGDDWVIMEERFESPSLAVSKAGNDSYNIYYAYYDDFYNQICFKVGTNNKTSCNWNDWGNDTQVFGQFYTHQGESGFVDNHRSLIAGQTDAETYWKKGDQELYAGEYVSIAVQNSYATGSKDVVVATWYDAIRQTWMYSYNANPMNQVNQTWKNATNDWSVPITLSGNAGEYCKIAFAADGSVHIAARKSNQILYTYLAKYTDTTAHTVLVDSGEDFSNIGIDIENTSSGVIPLITYYANSKAKLAYPVTALKNASEVPAGMSTVEGRISYNGNWEVYYVPTVKTVKKDNLNVCARSSYTSKTSTASFYAEGGKENGTCAVNGKDYPLLGYAIKEGTKFYIEIAQRKD